MTLSGIVERLGREVVIVCSPDGICRSADPRAARVLGARVGEPLATCADPGSVEKLEALFEDVGHGPVHGWEVCLIADGTPRTYCFEAESSDGGIVLVGCPVTNGADAALQSYQAALDDVAGMHRETSRQRSELEAKNRELREANSGLVSLHAELDEKNDTLRRSADVKARLVANISHEFRTPINSVLGLSRLLLERVDGELTEEQDRQVQFIRQNAESLRALIDDILDLSKIEAGKVSLRPRTFPVSELLSALRGTMRALPGATEVDLVVEEPADSLTITSDEAKIAQILRNLVSNALKFTLRGEVRVTASLAGSAMIAFRVADTGVGIAPQYIHTIFEEFVQIDSAAQRNVKGTGLGLSLSRRLATILGGTLTVESELGKGSVFTLIIPRVHIEAAQMEELVQRSRVLDPRRAPVLVVEDDRQTMFLYEKYLTHSGFQVIPARSTEQARAELDRVRPAAIVLDVMLEAESTWSFLRQVKENPATHDIPVMVVTVVDSSQKARALGADEFWLKPIDPDRMRRKLTELAKRGPVSLLVVDDDETSRYLIRKLLDDTPYVVHEAANAKDGVRLARERQPQVILLDFVLDDSTAFDVIDELKADPRTRTIPIIIQTGRTLAEVERERLARDATAILSKQSLSRELAIARIREALENAGVHR
jgi:signal transduction histidine kinase/CheY-like chemotaxis protein